MSNDIPDASALTAPPTDGGSDIPTAFWQQVKAILPDMSNLYLQPLDASSDMTFSDRISLIWQSARPVTEFFDLSYFNLPPLDHLSTRFGRNIETYLYNYFLLACLHLVLFSLVHAGSVFVLLCWLALVWFLFVAKKEAIDVVGRFSIDNNAKFVVAVSTAFLGIIFGNVSTLIISLAIFLLLVVGIHAIVREDASGDEVGEVAI